MSILTEDERFKDAVPVLLDHILGHQGIMSCLEILELEPLCYFLSKNLLAYRALVNAPINGQGIGESWTTSYEVAREHVKDQEDVYIYSAICTGLWIPTILDELTEVAYQCEYLAIPHVESAISMANREQEMIALQTYDIQLVYRSNSDDNSVLYGRPI